jgi:hypothetical protein
MGSLLNERKELLRWKDELAEIKVGLKYVRYLRAVIKAGFNPDQPRDETGRWSGRTTTQTNIVDADSRAMDQRSPTSAQYAAVSTKRIANYNMRKIS